MTTDAVRNIPPRMVSTADAARILGIAPITLSKWRIERTGPRIPYVKSGRYVRYRHDDLLAWLDANRREA